MRSGAAQAADATRGTSGLWGWTGSGQAFVLNLCALFDSRLMFHASHERGHLLQPLPGMPTAAVWGHGCEVTCQAPTSLSHDNPLGTVPGEETKARRSYSGSCPGFTVGKQWDGNHNPAPQQRGPPMAWSGAPLSGPALGE